MGSEARARLALGGLGAATLLGFQQVFAAGDYAGPALLGMLLAVGLVVGSRRFGLPTLLILPASLGALFWYLALVFETPHLLYGLPTLDAARSLATKVSTAYEVGRVDYAPVPLRPGYVAATVAGMWIAATLGELGTFRWRRPVLASVPTIGLFSFVVIVGRGEGTWFLVVLFLVALLTFWALSSAHLLRGWGRWLPTPERAATEPLAPAGGLARKMGAACIAAALVSPLVLPPLERGLVSWRMRDRAGSGAESENGRINPLVAIAPRLIQQSGTELFRVATETSTYWRLVSLGGFDGRRWHEVPVEPAASGDGAITTREPFPSPFDRLVYSITITGLRGENLPAAAEPVTVLMGTDASTRQDDLRYNAGTGDLYLRGGLEEGIAYQVETYAPSPSREALAAASVGGTVHPLYLQLPDGISDQVRSLGERWTEGADSPYEKLVALQGRLRSFDYSIRVPPASSSDYLTEFLTETRVGYCQQFATAFALLARLQGIPTRVSVGFLPGSPSPDADNELVVKGTHAHAWPEAYFDGIGWVAFEPTPRSVAAPPEYSVPAARGAPGGAPLPEGEDSGPDLNLFLAEEDRYGEGAFRREPAPFELEPAAQEGDDGAWREAFSALARVMGALLLLLLVAIPALKWLRFYLRYRGASTPVELVSAAYAHFEAEARELASSRRRSESAARYARRLVSAHRLPQIEASHLAALYETAAFGPHGVGKDDAEEARRLSRFLRERLWSDVALWERTLRFFSPRNLVDRA